MDDHETRCAELYRLGNLPSDVPDGLLIVGSTTCTLCKQTMRHNGYPTATSDGTPITWVNLGEQDGLYKFYTTPGVSWSDENQCAMANEHKLGGTPIYLWVKGGKVVNGPIAYGEQQAGGLDRMAAIAQLATATQ